MNNRNKSDDLRNNVCGVAVIGIGFRLPGSSSDPKTLWNNLINKFDGVVDISDRWNSNFYLNGEIKSHRAGLISLEDEIKQFDPLMFSISPSDCDLIDPQQRLLLKCVWESLEDAHIDPIKLRGSNTSVFIGISTTDYQNNLKDQDSVLENIFSSTNHSASNRISHCFDFRSQSLSIDTACSSSSSAIAMGYKTIINGISNYSIVGGSNLLLDEVYLKAYSHLNMLSKSGSCKPFDADADGFVRCEGCCVAVLKNLDQAIKDGDRIYCVIDGVNMNSDGNNEKNNFYSPSKIGQYENIKEMFERNPLMVHPSKIDYCECHGTGTPTGDPIEVEAISNMLKQYHSSENPLLIGSFKSNIGHVETCSGIASLIKCCLMFKNRTFAPNINFNKPNPAIKFDEWNLKVVTEALPFPTDKKVSILINNFGITGSNTCMIVSEFNSNDYISTSTLESAISTTVYQHESDKSYLIPVSANSKESLNRYISSIQNNYNNLSNDCSFFDFVQFQILSKSPHLYQRSVILANKWPDIKNSDNIIKTNNSITSNMKSSEKSMRNNKDEGINICFVFSGQGTQYIKMAIQLYNNDSTFKSTIDLIDSKLTKYYGYSVLKKLRSIKDDDNHIINYPIIAQPSIVMIQIALHETLTKQWNINPNFIIGHSLGELTSQYCSGSIDLDTLCYILYHRSKAQQNTVGSGRMLSINISPDKFNQKFSNQYPSIEISCYNSNNSIVIGGNEDQLKEIESTLKQQNVHTTFLSTPSSFHTSSQDICKELLLNLQFKSTKPTIPLLSTIYQDFFDGESKVFNSEYVFRNVREPVYFTQTIEKLYQHLESNKTNNNLIFIEVSPHSALTYYLKQLKPIKSTIQTTILSTLNKNKADINQIHQLISTLYCNHNYQINFNNQLLRSNSRTPITSTYKYKELNLPRYQWDDKSYYKEAPNQRQHRLDGPPIDILGIRNLRSPFISYITIIDIKKPSFQYLKGHVVKGKYIFPGAGYIENIINSFNSNNTSNDMMINYLEFKVPVIFIEGVPKQLQTNIHQISKKDYRVQFHYYETTSNKWIQSSSGLIQLFNFNNSKEKKLDIGQLKSFCNKTKLSSNDLYSYIKVKTGISYSDSFKLVKKCYRGINCSLNKVEFIKINQNINTAISCATLDCCAHGGLGLIEENTQLIFDRIEGLKFYSSNFPKDYSSDLYVYIKYLCKKGDSFEFSSIIMLQDGTIIFEIEKFVMASTTQVFDRLKIQYPSSEFQTTFLQLKDCEAVTNLELFNFNDHRHSSSPDNESFFKFIPSILYHYLRNKKPEITIDEIKQSDIDSLKVKYLSEDLHQQHSRLFQFVFETIKYHHQQEYIESEWSENNLLFHTILTKSTKIAIDLLFPSNDKELDSNPSSLFENGLLEQFYTHPFYTINQDKLSEILKESLRPLLKKKNVIRILELGGGTGSLSITILNKLNQLLIEEENDNGKDFNEIEIEYTFSDISSSFIPAAKEKLSFFNGKGSVLFKTINVEDSLIENQKLKPNYYDFVVMSGVLHVVKKIVPSLNEIHKVLKNNGYLLFIEPCYKALLGDTIFSVFSQWWSFEDTDLRSDRCCMTEDQWFNVLSKSNFKNIKISKSNHISNILIHSQKEPQEEELKSSSNKNIIVFGNDINNESFMNGILQLFQKKQSVSSIEEFNNISNQIDNNTIIYFIKAINQLDRSNFKQVSLEYVQVVQYLIKNKLEGTKLVLITSNTYHKESSNYLASSVTGSFRYFLDQFESLLLFSFDFDTVSLSNKDNHQIISNLINTNYNNEREFFIRDNKVFVERIKLESNVFRKYKSNSIEQLPTKKNNHLQDSSDNDNNNNLDSTRLYSKLNENLEFQLECKASLGENQVEVQVKAIGINYKDYLVYTRNVPAELMNHNSNIHELEIGVECSGVIVSVGSNVNDFKVGDLIFTLNNSTTSSHIILNKDELCHKPDNITFNEAASIPAVYLTSLHSIFKIGKLNIKKNESILIHSATGGVGLSAIEILKWKGFKSHLFVTVGSPEKEQYLKDKYGSFITGIYSSRNKDYVYQIKERLKELGSNKQGVDVILNTLPSEYIESNFRCLNKSGRIVDLTITHLNQNEFIDYSKFKYNYSYSNVEIYLLDFTYLTKLLKKISQGISSGSLSLIPITEYSVTNIKDAIEYINQRKHIGKIVVNYDIDITNNLIESYVNKNNSNNNKTQEIIFKKDYEITKELGKTVLITGQSGIALEIIKWINKYSKSVQNIIVLSKSKLKWELELLINSNKDNTAEATPKINFYFKSVDVEHFDQIDNVISQIIEEQQNINQNERITNIDTIIHMAFENDIREPLKVDMSSINISHGAKTLGAINLHELQLKYKWNTKNFILASSISVIYGSFNQCAYTQANQVLDTLAKYRKSIGLSALSVNWGHIGTTGIVARNNSVGELLEGIGLEPMPTQILLGTLDLFLQNQNNQDFNNLIINRMNLDRLPFSNLYTHKFSYKINSYNQNKVNSNQISNNNSNGNEDSTAQIVVSKIAELLSIDLSNININNKLLDFGIDSLLIVQVKNFIDEKFKRKYVFNISELQKYSINDIIKKLTN